MDENVLKFTPDRLISMDIHKRSDILAINGCDRNGTVCFAIKVNEIIIQKKTRKMKIILIFFIILYIKMNNYR